MAVLPIGRWIQELKLRFPLRPNFGEKFAKDRYRPSPAAFGEGGDGTGGGGSGGVGGGQGGAMAPRERDLEATTYERPWASHEIWPQERTRGLKRRGGGVAGQASASVCEIGGAKENERNYARFQTKVSAGRPPAPPCGGPGNLSEQ